MDGASAATPASTMLGPALLANLLWAHMIALSAAADSKPSAEAGAGVQRAASSLPACRHKVSKTSDVVRQFISLAADGDGEQARTCLLAHLGGKGSASAWALAAAIFPAHASSFSEQAKAALKQRPMQRFPSSYDVLGPLPVGKNEVDGDPLASFGGAFAHWLQRPDGGAIVSELAPGGYVKWRSVKVEPPTAPALVLEWPPQARWQTLVSTLSQQAVLELQAWAVGTFAIAVEGTYRLDCKGGHKVYWRSAAEAHLPPRLLNADIYQSSPHGGGGFSLGRLPAGAYVLSMRVRTVHQARPSCTLSAWATDRPWTLAFKSQTVPDVVLGAAGHGHQLCGGHVAVAVHNGGGGGGGGGGGWLRNASVKALDKSVSVALTRVGAVGGVGAVEEPHAAAAAGAWDVAPGQLRLLPLRLSLDQTAKPPCPFSARVAVRYTDDSGSPTELAVTVGGGQCRTPEQSIVCTHIDHDGAVSAAAVIRPLRATLCDPAHGCPAILTMHGTSRPVRDSADAYKFKPADAKPSDEFTFGVERFWVIAPTHGHACMHMHAHMQVPCARACTHGACA